MSMTIKFYTWFSNDLTTWYTTFVIPNVSIEHSKNKIRKWKSHQKVVDTAKNAILCHYKNYRYIEYNKKVP